MVNGNGRLKWPQRMAGQCGDPFQSDRRHEKLGRATAAFVEGQTVSFKVKITAYHKGRFEFRICKTKDGKLSEACFERNALVRG